MIDYNMAVSYLKGDLEYNLLKKASQELLLHNMNRSNTIPIEERKDFLCPNFNTLTLDEFGNLLPCCSLPKNHKHYSIGKIMDLSNEEIHMKKTNHPGCKECVNSGYFDWISANQSNRPEFINHLESIGYKLNKYFHITLPKRINSFICKAKKPIYSLLNFRPRKKQRSLHPPAKSCSLPAP